MNKNINEIKIFVGFSSKDEKNKQGFAKYLNSLSSGNNIIYYDFGTLNHVDGNHSHNHNNLNPQKNIEELSSSHVILFLVSSNFILLENFNKYVNLALKARKTQEAIVIPIILDLCHWKKSALKDLEPLPKNGVPVTNRKWTNKNQAFYEIADAIDKIIEEIREIRRQKQEAIENYEKKKFQYKGIVQDVYRQNHNLSDESKKQLKYHQECLEIQDRDARAIEAEVQEQFIIDEVDEIEEDDYGFPSAFKNASIHSSFSETEGTALGCGCLIILLIALSTLFNLFNSQNNLLNEKGTQAGISQEISRENKLQRAKQFPIIFLNALNAHECQKAWKMRAEEYKLPSAEFIKRCSQATKVEYKLSKVIFEDNKKVKLYVEWQYCQNQNLYYVAEHWWLQWNTNNQQWLLNNTDSKNPPQRRANCEK